MSGSYRGGSTVLGRRSDWFEKGKRDGDGRLLKDEPLKIERFKYGIEIYTGPIGKRQQKKQKAPAPVSKRK